MTPLRRSQKESRRKRSKRGYLQFIAIFVLLWKPTTCIPDDPWKNYWFGNGILGKAEIFNTTVCFTIPLFSFTFPSFNEVESMCSTMDGEESCLPNEPSHTELFKQNVLGQAIFFGVTAISVAASLAFPTFLNNQNEDSVPGDNTSSDSPEYASDKNAQLQEKEIATNTITKFGHATAKSSYSSAMLFT